MQFNIPTSLKISLSPLTVASSAVAALEGAIQDPAKTMEDAGSACVSHSLRFLEPLGIALSSERNPFIRLGVLPLVVPSTVAAGNLAALGVGLLAGPDLVRTGLSEGARFFRDHTRGSLPLVINSATLTALGCVVMAGDEAKNLLGSIIR